MHKRHHSHKKVLIGKDILILPFLFCVLIYALCALVIIPSASSYIAVADMFFSEGDKNFSNEHVNIFVPVEDSEPEPEPEGDNKQHADSEKRTNIIKASDFTFPSYGYQFGEIIIPDCQIHAKLFFGDSYSVLKSGVGIYNGSSVPGYGKTILAAGHNNTYFNGLKYAKKGQIIKIRTNYGNYQYEITDTQVKDMDDSSAYDLDADHENLILYTCYPFDELGLTPNRFFVYAKFISGPIIDKHS